MKTILFTWNPKKWSWTNIAEAIIETNQTGKYYDEWSCGVSKNIKPGDRVFLVKLGSHPKGIIGSGYVVSNVFTAPHWDGTRGKLANKVDIEFDVLSEAPIICDEDLKVGKLARYDWYPQSSGTSIPDEIANELEIIWKEKTCSTTSEQIKEISASYSEGRRIRRESYRYERNAEARLECLKIHGYSCYICGFNFEKAYGELGKDFIHVHHKIPVSEIGQKYKVNPKNDLIPVCPNCHAIIHRKVPFLDIEDFKRQLQNIATSNIV